MVKSEITMAHPPPPLTAIGCHWPPQQGGEGIGGDCLLVTTIDSRHTTHTLARALFCGCRTDLVVRPLSWSNTRALDMEKLVFQKNTGEHICVGKCIKVCRPHSATCNLLIACCNPLCVFVLDC